MGYEIQKAEILGLPGRLQKPRDQAAPGQQDRQAIAEEKPQMKLNDFLLFAAFCTALFVAFAVGANYEYTACKSNVSVSKSQK